jgi:cytochrome c oxidase subunit 1
MSTVSHAHDHHDDHAHDHPHGWRRWLYATNHKDIGTLYLLFSFFSLIAGGIMALLIRLELFQPGLQFIRPELFNQLTTMHGLVMVFARDLVSLSSINPFLSGVCVCPKPAHNDRL